MRKIYFLLIYFFGIITNSLAIDYPEEPKPSDKKPLAKISPKKEKTDPSDEIFVFNHSNLKFENKENYSLNQPMSSLLAFDPVRFSINSQTETLEIGKEVELVIKAEWLEVHPMMMFTLEGSNEFTLKMLFPEGFVLTGGTYYDFIKGKVSKENPVSEFIIKGYFESIKEKSEFKLLRSHSEATLNDPFVVKSTLSLNPDTNKQHYSIVRPTRTDNTKSIDCAAVPPTPTIVANTTTPPRCGIVVGDIIKLDAIGCTNNTVVWSNGQTGNTIRHTFDGKPITFTAVCGVSCSSPPSNPIVIDGKTIIVAPNADQYRTVCPKIPTVLEATCLPGYPLWNTGATTNTITVSTVGNYTVQCQNGCTTPARTITYFVSLNPDVSPKPIVTADKTTFCEGQFATLTSDKCSGTIRWSDGQIGNPIRVTKSGSYTAVCEGYCGNSPPSDPIVISTTSGLNITASSNSPSGQISVGGTLNLSAISKDNIREYYWKGPNDFFSTVQNPTIGKVPQSAEGIYYLTAYNDAGCMAISTTQVVFGNNNPCTFPPLPPIISYKTISNQGCFLMEGDVVELTATGCTGAVHWNIQLVQFNQNLRTSEIVGNPIQITLDSDITYEAVCKNGTGAGCTSNPSYVSFQLNTQSVSYQQTPYTLPCNGGGVTLSASCLPGYPIWNNGTTGNFLTVTQAGTYSFSCGNTNCFENSGQTYNLTVNPATTNGNPPVIAANKTTLCREGDSALLTATGCTGELNWIYLGYPQMKQRVVLNKKNNANPIEVFEGGDYVATCITSCGESDWSNIITLNFGVAHPIVASNNSPNKQINIGGTLNLSANDGGFALTNYQWSGPNNFSSSAVNPSISPATSSNNGIYTVTAWSRSGCQSSATTSVVIGEGSFETCEGYEIKSTDIATGKDTLVLSRDPNDRTKYLPIRLSIISTNGGSTNGFTYQWIAPEGVLLSNPTSSTIDITKPGIYKVNLTREGSTCSLEIEIGGSPCILKNTQYSACKSVTINAPTNVNLAQALPVGSKFYAADYLVEVLESFGSPSGWSGKGKVEVVLLKGIKVEFLVEFDNIQINDCYELINGTVKVAYDPSWGNMVDVDGIIEDLKDLYNSLFSTLDGIKELIENETDPSKIQQGLDNYQTELDKLLQSIYANNEISDEQKTLLINQITQIINSTNAYETCSAPSGGGTSGQGNGRIVNIQNGCGDEINNLNTILEDTKKKVEAIRASEYYIYLRPNGKPVKIKRNAFNNYSNASVPVTADKPQGALFGFTKEEGNNTVFYIYDPSTGQYKNGSTPFNDCEYLETVNDNEPTIWLQRRACTPSQNYYDGYYCHFKDAKQKFFNQSSVTFDDLQRFNIWCLEYIKKGQFKDKSNGALAVNDKQSIESFIRDLNDYFKTLGVEISVVAVPPSDTASVRTEAEQKGLKILQKVEYSGIIIEFMIGGDSSSLSECEKNKINERLKVLDLSGLNPSSNTFTVVKDVLKTVGAYYYFAAFAKVLCPLDSTNFQGINGGAAECLKAGLAGFIYTLITDLDVVEMVQGIVSLVENAGGSIIEVYKEYPSNLKNAYSKYQNGDTNFSTQEIIGILPPPIQLTIKASSTVVNMFDFMYTHFIKEGTCWTTGEAVAILAPAIISGGSTLLKKAPSAIKMAGKRIGKLLNSGDELLSLLKTKKVEYKDIPNGSGQTKQIVTKELNDEVDKIYEEINGSYVPICGLCLAQNTEIYGTGYSFEDLPQGTSVSVLEKDGIVRQKTIWNKLTNVVDEVTKIWVKGEELISASNHEFITQTGKIAAKNLIKGTSVFSLFLSSWLPIDSIAHIRENTIVEGLSIGDAIGYGVGKMGVLVSGSKKCFNGLTQEISDDLDNMLGITKAQELSQIFNKLPKTYSIKKVDGKIKIFDETGTEWAEILQDKIKAKGGNPGKWNELLNKFPPLTNHKYEIDDYSYQTDNVGRVSKVNGQLKGVERGRNEYQQGISVGLKDGTQTVDHGGHLIANILNGPGEQLNYVPMKGNLNTGAWKSMENKWSTALSNGKVVNVEITPVYNGNLKRPTKFEVEYSIDGQWFYEEHIN